MGQITTVINVCDRCGSRHNAEDYMKEDEWGQLTLAWRGDTGCRSWQGDTAGKEVHGKAWLCMPCMKAFELFLKNH